jgi:protein-S-isoprenylcysteine O-methyltransferase Ste14
MKKIRLFATLYFAVQGVAVLAWWILLFSAPSSRKYFQMGESETMLLAFWLPDLFLLAVGSFAVSAFVWFENRFTVIAVWFVVGAISYATFYCLAFAMMTDSGWLGVVLMFPAMIWSGNFAIGLSPAFHEKMFRNSVEAKTSWILAKTFAQIVVVWSLTLFVFPALIVWIETKIGIAQFAFPFQKIFSPILFVLISSIGVSGAITMAKIGRGTPLPLDSASKLVVAGIYAFVRNPMAISGIGQGLAVGLFLGSPLVLLYALMGGAIWQMIFRQLEEEDLHEKFGADFEKYRANVCCWIPRLKRFEL